MLLKYALRNIKKRPVLNGIKIIGLALGLYGMLFIALFVKNELGYDRQHQKAERIFRLTVTAPNILEGNHFARFFASQILPDITKPIPGIEDFVRLQPIRGKLIRNKERYFGIDQGFAVDESYLNIFDVTLLKGDKHTAFTKPGSVVISAVLAENIFGTTDPIGQIISLPQGHFNASKADFEVTGVMANMQQQSHFHPDILFMPGKDKIEGWAYQYLLLVKNANPSQIAEKLSNQLVSEFTPEGAKEKVEVDAHLMNLADIHLKSNLFREIEPNSSLSNIWVLVLAGIVLLLVSLSNFASLNLGMAGYLATFLAFNQILGSSKRIVTTYFTIESALVILSAIGLVFLGMYQLNGSIYENYQINLLEGNGLFVTTTILSFGLLMLVAGLQPVIKNRFKNLTLSQSLKKTGKVKGHRALLVTQFTLAIILLIGVVVISKQTSYGLDNAMGAKESIVCLPLVHSEVQKDFEIFKTELLKESEITSVSAMMDTPGSETHDMFSYTLQDVPEPESGTNTIGVFATDYSFADVFGLHFLSGTNFSENNTDEDGNGEYLINESGLKHLGFQDAHEIINKDFGLISPVDGVELPKGKIIGVVEDFHLSGLRSKVEPLALFKRKNNWLNSIVISYNSESPQDAIQSITKVWTGLFPKYPMDYVDVSTIYNDVYKTELLQRNLILLFALISIFVCTMGVLGLALMVAQSRYKEIGIRKVNGASKLEILTLLNRDFLKWVLLAFIVAIPLAYFAATKWLEGFVYKIALNPWMFLFSGGIILLITLLTVSWQSYKAANQNPVESLRTE